MQCKDEVSVVLKSEFVSFPSAQSEALSFSLMTLSFNLGFCNAIQEMSTPSVRKNNHSFLQFPLKL